MNGIPKLMIFSPQNSTAEVLDNLLTPKRRKLATQILTSIHQSIQSKSSHHHLLIGSRGAGKTHVLGYVCKHIKNKSLRVVCLSEEERGITSLFDFLIVCLRAMELSTPEIRAHIQPSQPEQMQFSAIQFLEKQLKGKPLLIILENLSDLLKGLGEAEQRNLRGFLQSHPAISLLASTVELFSESQNPDHPFYGFFEIHPLIPLEEKEIAAYLQTLANARGDQELAQELGKDTAKPRIQAVHHLTGGNHRLLAMLSNFMTVQGLDELVEPFVQLVDRELTPYYQQRLDRLSPQQNKILQAIADHHGAAINVQEIADYTFLSSQTVSKVLHDLLSGQYVVRHAKGRESYYELREPLLRLVLDIKQGRNRSLPLIVSFLKYWYQEEELKELSSLAPEFAKDYYNAALTALKNQSTHINEKEDTIDEKIQLIKHLIEENKYIITALEDGLKTLGDEKSNFIIELLEALRQSTLGDPKALLKLPLEIRSLFTPAQKAEPLPTASTRYKPQKPRPNG